MASSEPALRRRLETIIALAEHLHATDFAEEAAFRAAITAADRLCDEAVAVRWKLLRGYRSRYGQARDRDATQAPERVRRLLEDKGFRVPPPAPDGS